MTGKKSYWRACQITWRHGEDAFRDEGDGRFRPKHIIVIIIIVIMVTIIIVIVIVIVVLHTSHD